MGGAVKSVAKAVGIADKPKPTPTVAAPAAEVAKQVTRGETVAAKQQQAAFRARRGSGASLLSYNRTLGGQSTLEGEDIA